METIVNAIHGRQFVRPFKYGGSSIQYTLQAKLRERMPAPRQLAALADGNHAVIVGLPGHAVVLEMATTNKFRTLLESDTPLKYMSFHIWDPWPRLGRRKIRLESAINPGDDNFIDGIVVISLRERVIEP
jgi:hypothetical protein